MSEVIHVISLGAGVQSSTMALMAAAGEIGPMPYAAVFADTQAEPASVYKWLDWLEEQLPFPVYRVTKGSLAERATTKRVSAKGVAYTKSSPPAFLLDDAGKKGIMMRQCTGDFKLGPIFSGMQKLRRQAKRQHGWKHLPAVTQWIGISTDEAVRMKPARQSYLTSIWPLIDKGMSRDDCKAWMKTHGFPEPPRSSCVFCPYHSDDEWIRLRDQEPIEFARALEFESDLQRATRGVLPGMPYLHASRKPLAEVEFKPGSNKLAFGNECEGMCGN